MVPLLAYLLLPPGWKSGNIFATHESRSPWGIPSLTPLSQKTKSTLKRSQRWGQSVIGDRTIVMQKNQVFQSIAEAIGNTPIVKLNKIGADLDVNLYAKLEFLNPGGSIKDRLGWWLVEDAEKKGLLKPGGTIVEGTSGNTGFGLAIAAAIKGYKSIFVLPDKMSQEKISNLRAFGAKVVVTPTAVEPDDPRSYYSVSKRLAKETPNAVYMNQYNNLANRDCHYRTTGPEVLEQMPDIDAFIAGIGTGGTICGVGKYFKEKNSPALIVAVDPIGSIVYDKFKTGKTIEAGTYKIEGIGEDFIPDNYDFDVIDDMVQVDDKESFLMTRELLTKEGMFVGISSGSAVVGALRWVKEQGEKLRGKNVLIVLPDSGNRYLSKVFNDDWMREAGFLESSSLGNVKDLLEKFMLQSKEGVLTAHQNQRISDAVALMQEKGVSQLPVRNANGKIQGIITESSILSALYEDRAKGADSIESLIDPSVEFVEPTDSIEKVSKLLTEGKYPLVSAKAGDTSEVIAIITKIDLLSFLGSQA
jgi:cystathionine beta-synthase